MKLCFFKVIERIKTYKPTIITLYLSYTAMDLSSYILKYKKKVYIFNIVIDSSVKYNVLEKWNMAFTLGDPN